MTQITKDDWEDILTDIQDQKATLLIGTEKDAIELMDLGHTNIK